MKRIILLLIILASPLFAEVKNVSVSLDSTNYTRVENRSLLFGCFFEYIHEFINGESGLWAQELYDRGFDHFNNENFSMRWEPVNPQSNSKVKLIYGRGYNENGEYYQSISSDAVGIAGLKQNIYFDTEKGGEFYIYLRNNSSSPSMFTLQILSQTGYKVFYADSVRVVDSTWKKFSFKVPPFLSTNRISVALCLSGKGNIDLDEVSYMPSDNVNGVRKEFFDMFAAWRPGVIRYPGGWFSDTPLCRLDNMIGDIDKRRSPQRMDRDYQRLDFGINEFMAFCRSVGAEAHMVVNLKEAPASEAADWVDYCNGDISTPYGKRRAADGHPEPYDVRYWEIGNEQWNADYMLPRYEERFDSMYARDNRIKGIVDGDIWQGKPYFNRVMNTLGDKCSLYGWHPYLGLDQKLMNVEDSARTFNLVMGTVYMVEGIMKEYDSFLNEYNLFPRAKQAITEHCLLWGPLKEIDTTWRNSTLEAGLYQMGTLFSVLRHSKTMELYEKTFGYGHIRIGYNKAGKRVIYPTPFHTATEFLARNSGDVLYNPKVESPIMKVGIFNGDLTLDEPILDVLACSKKDTLYIYLMNITMSDSVQASITHAFELDSSKTRAFIMSSASIYDFNSPDHPDKIKFREIKIGSIDSLIIEPRSVYVIKSVFKGIKDTTLVSPSLTIAPNPVKNYMEIKSEGYGPILQVAIYDYFGRKLITKEGLNENESILDMSELSPGCYFIDLTTTGKRQLMKFIKNR